MREAPLWPVHYLWWIVSQSKTRYCYIFENFPRFMIILYKELFPLIFYSVKSFWRAKVMKTFSKINFCFKFTWSLTHPLILHFYSYTFNPFKTFRWSFFPFECLFRTPCKTFESSVKISIPNFYDSNALVPSASEAGTKYFRQKWKCLSKEI